MINSETEDRTAALIIERGMSKETRGGLVTGYQRSINRTMPPQDNQTLSKANTRPQTHVTLSEIKTTKSIQTQTKPNLYAQTLNTDFGSQSLQYHPS